MSRTRLKACWAVTVPAMAHLSRAILYSHCSNRPELLLTSDQARPLIGSILPIMFALDFNAEERGGAQWVAGGNGVGGEERVGDGQRLRVRSLGGRGVGLVLAVWCGLAGQGILRAEAVGSDSPPLVELAPFHVRNYWAIQEPDGYAGIAQTLDAGVLENTGAADLAEVLEYQAGVPMRSYSGNSASAEVDLRGFGERSGLRTLILVDGQPLNRPDMGSPSWLEIPFSQVQRVEILRGAQTARFGGQAAGGVINIVTKLGTQTGPTTQLETSGGSFKTWLGRGTQTFSIRGVAGAISLEGFRTDGYRQNAGYEARSLRLNLGDGSADSVAWRVGASWLADRVEFPGALTGQRYRADPRQSIYSAYGQEDFYFSDNRKGSANAALRLPLDSAWAFDLRADGVWRELSWNMGPGSHADNVLWRWETQPAVTWSEPGQVWQLGGSVVEDRLELDFYADLARRDRTGTARLRRRNQALFLTHERDGGDLWKLRGAGRLEGCQVTGEDRDLRAPDDPALNWQGSTSQRGWAVDLDAVCHPVAAWELWVRYNRFGRFPVADEIAAYAGFPLAQPFNQDLRAETGHNFETGAAFEAGGWKVRGNCFALLMDGEIIYDYLRNLNVNFCDTRRLGFEASLRRETEQWAAGLFYTFIDATWASGPFEGNRVALVPRHRLSATATFRPVKAVSLSAEYSVNSSAFEGNDLANVQPPLPAWQTVNVQARWRLDRRWTVFLRVNNLLDERYATLKYLGSWYPAPGRHFRMGLSALF